MALWETERQRRPPSRNIFWEREAILTSAVLGTTSALNCMTMRPLGTPPTEMSKKTFGFSPEAAGTAASLLPPHPIVKRRSVSLSRIFFGGFVGLQNGVFVDIKKFVVDIQNCIYYDHRLMDAVYTCVEISREPDSLFVGHKCMFVKAISLFCVP